MSIAQVVYSVSTMVTGATQTPVITMPGCFLNVYLQVPTMAGGYGADTPIWIRGSADGVTFFRYTNIETNTNVVGANDFVVASSTSQRMIYVPNFSFNYAKIETSAAATNGVAAQSQFKFICISNQ